MSGDGSSKILDNLFDKYIGENTVQTSNTFLNFLNRKADTSSILNHELLRTYASLFYATKDGKPLPMIQKALVNYFIACIQNKDDNLKIGGNAAISFEKNSSTTPKDLFVNSLYRYEYHNKDALVSLVYYEVFGENEVIISDDPNLKVQTDLMAVIEDYIVKESKDTSADNRNYINRFIKVMREFTKYIESNSIVFVNDFQKNLDNIKNFVDYLYPAYGPYQNIDGIPFEEKAGTVSQKIGQTLNEISADASSSPTRANLFMEIDKDPNLANEFMIRVAGIEGQRKTKRDKLRSIVTDLAGLAFMIPEKQSRDYLVTEMADGALHENNSMMGVKRKFTAEEKEKFEKEKKRKQAEEEQQEKLDEARRQAELYQVQKTAAEAKRAFEATEKENIEKEKKREQYEEKKQQQAVGGRATSEKTGGYPFQSIEKVINDIVDRRLSKKTAEGQTLSQANQQSNIDAIETRLTQIEGRIPDTAAEVADRESQLEKLNGAIQKFTDIEARIIKLEENQAVPAQHINDGEYRQSIITEIRKEVQDLMINLKSESKQSLELELRKLQQLIEESGTKTSEDIRQKLNQFDEIRKRIEIIETDIKKLSEDVQGRNVAMDEIQSRLTQLEGARAEIESTKSELENIGELETRLNKRFDELDSQIESHIDTKIQTETKDMIESLKQQIDDSKADIERQIKDIQSSPLNMYSNPMFDVNNTGPSPSSLITSKETTSSIQSSSPMMHSKTLFDVNNTTGEPSPSSLITSKPNISYYDDELKRCLTDNNIEKYTTGKKERQRCSEEEFRPWLERHIPQTTDFYDLPIQGNKSVIGKYANLINGIKTNTENDWDKLNIVLAYIRYKYWNEVPMILAYINDESKYMYLMDQYINKQIIKWGLPKSINNYITMWRHVIDSYRINKDKDTESLTTLMNNPNFNTIMSKELNSGVAQLASSLQKELDKRKIEGGGGDDEDIEEQEKEMDEETRRLHEYKKSVEDLENAKSQIVEAETTIVSFKPILDKYTTDTPLSSLEQTNKEYQEKKLSASQIAAKKDGLKQQLKAVRGKDINPEYQKYAQLLRIENKLKPYLNTNYSDNDFDKLKTDINSINGITVDEIVAFFNEKKKQDKNKESIQIPTVDELKNNAKEFHENKKEKQLNDIIENLKKNPTFEITNDNEGILKDTIKKLFTESYSRTEKTSGIDDTAFDSLIREIPSYKRVKQEEASISYEADVKKNEVASIESKVVSSVDPVELQSQTELLSEAKNKLHDAIDTIKKIISKVHIDRFKNQWSTELKDLREGSASIESLVQKLIDRTIKSMEMVKTRVDSIHGMIKQDESSEQKDNYDGGASKGGEKDLNDPQVIYQVLSEKITKLKDLIEQMMSFSQRNSNSTALIATNGEPSMFVQLYNKYIEDRSDPNISKLEANEGLVEGVSANVLAPRQVLQSNAIDKTVFVGVTLLLRLFSLSLTNFLIDRKKIKKIEHVLASYLVIYTLFFTLVVLLINIDTYRMRIIFNYINVHSGYGTVITHIVIVWIVAALIFIVLRNIKIIQNPTNSKNTEARTSEERARLRNRISLISMMIWLFTTIVVAVS